MAKEHKPANAKPAPVELVNRDWVCTMDDGSKHTREVSRRTVTATTHEGAIAAFKKQLGIISTPHNISAVEIEVVEDPTETEVVAPAAE